VAYHDQYCLKMTETILIGIAIAGLVITVVSSLIALAKAQKLLADTPENHYKKSGSKPMKKVIS